jgi:hypothetical protein
MAASLTAPSKGFSRNRDGARLERLGSYSVVVCADHDDGNRVAHLVEPTLQIQSIQPRKAKINKSTVGPLRSTRVEKGFRRFVCSALISGRFKEPADGTLNGLVIVNDCDCGDILGRSHSVPCGRDSNGTLPLHGAPSSVIIKPLVKMQDQTTGVAHLYQSIVVSRSPHRWCGLAADKLDYRTFGFLVLQFSSNPRL